MAIYYSGVVGRQEVKIMGSEWKPSDNYDVFCCFINDKRGKLFQFFKLRLLLVLIWLPRWWLDGGISI